MLLLLAACEPAQPAADQEAVAETAPAAPQPACASREFEGSAFTVCPYDARKDELRLALRVRDGAPLRSFSALETALGEDAGRVRFAMNAGMYDEDGMPIGLYVANGKQEKKINLRSGGGNFHLLPNGVFAVDAKGRVSVTPSKAFAKTVPHPRWATQSGPMLVIDGKLHPRFDRDGDSRLARNGVGVRNASTAFFVISEAGVSFGRFARFFRDGLGCRDALYLDGSVSSLWDTGAGRQDSFSRLGPMIVVLKRPQPAR